MEKEWLYTNLPPQKQVQDLAEELKINNNLSTLLLQNKIDSFEKAKDFFNPLLANLNNPFEMKGMQSSVERLQRAIQEKEKILIFGDYDVDGISGLALLIGFLREKYDKLIYYLPDRMKEGYGVSKQSIDWAIKQEINLIITVGCGASEYEAIELGKASEIDFIVCDHHLPEKDIPEVYAFLNPSQEDCNYPFDKLSSTGIAFQFLNAYCKTEEISLNELFLHLDLVALSIAADMLPIIEENRILMYYGLKILNQRPRIGFKVLLQQMRRFSKNIEVRDLAFGITPRLNATGRISHARKAVELLLAEDYSSAKQWVESIEQDNRRRQELGANITKEALAIINQTEEKNTPATILYQSHWHLGVLGIVAGNCIDAYPKPTILLTKLNGKISGSARSTNNFDMFEALKSCENLLEEYGGHSHAAGLSLLPENLPIFQEKFNSMAETNASIQINLPNKQKKSRPLNISLKINISDINENFYKVLKKFAPFGTENMRPLFSSENIVIEICEVWRTKHLRMWIRDKAASRENMIEAMGWGMAELEQKVIRNPICNLAYYIEENPSNNPPTIQLRVKHLKWNTA